MGSGDGVVANHRLKGTQPEIRWQCVKPIGWPVDFHERLNSLAAARKIIAVIVSIHAEGSAPLPKIIQACVERPFSWAWASTVRITAASIAIMAMTTSNSIMVNPRLRIQS